MAEQRNGNRPGPKVTEQASGKTPTTEQLRADIDEGRTRDKVDHPDPATAPLGTDAEAAGAPPSRQSVAADRERAHANERPRDGQGPPPGGRPWLIWAIVAVVVIAGIALYWLV